MTAPVPRQGWLVLTLIVFGAAACSPAAASSLNAGAPTLESNPGVATLPALPVTETPVPTQTPASTATPLPSPTGAPTITPTPLPPTATPCGPEVCAYSGRLFLQRPIVSPGVDTVDRSYPFGSTQEQKRDPHHGVEFLNPFGTPVHAAAGGVVVVAEDDRQYFTDTRYELTAYGPFPYFYGNLVILEHQPPPGLDGPLYTLYAHLSEILVVPGQAVQAGQEIGRVGLTGAATGSHLHFEVRYGANDYAASRNPELWLQPRMDAAGQLGGALAVHITGPDGQAVAPESVVLERLSAPDGPAEWQVYPQAYEEAALLGQPPYEESFGIGDLVPGWYRVSFVWQGVQRRLVEVFPGSITVLTVRSD